MPTYQSAPFYPILFADMAARSNPYGFQPLKGNMLVHAQLYKADHPEFKQYADSRVFARLQTNKSKDSEMLKGPPSIKGNHTFTTHRGMEKVMSGGTVWTRGAEKSIQDLMRDRKFQLDAIDQASFESPTSPQIQPQITPSDTFALDKLFSDLYSSVDEGVVDRSSITTMNSIMTAFLTKGDQLPDHKFAEYKSILASIELELESMYGRSNLEFSSEKEFRQTGRFLRLLHNDVQVLLSYIKEFEQYLGEPTKKKAARLAAIRGKLLASRGKYVPSEEEIRQAKEEAREEEEREAMANEDVYGNRAAFAAYGPGYVAQQAERITRKLRR
jgi:hypothetical protein